FFFFFVYLLLYLPISHNTHQGIFLGTFHRPTNSTLEPDYILLPFAQCSSFPKTTCPPLSHSHHIPKPLRFSTHQRMQLCCCYCLNQGGALFVHMHGIGPLSPELRRGAGPIQYLPAADPGLLPRQTGPGSISI
ncbi:hypothetical protein F5Y15DRAFT_371956, partial [Xylariaceae sp. FL0016]